MPARGEASCALTKSLQSPRLVLRRCKDRWMGARAFLIVGALIGLGLGVLVSVTTDVPFAPEVGLLLGALIGWLSRRRWAPGRDEPGLGGQWRAVAGGGR